MSNDRDMPASWRENARRHETELGAAVERAREARAGAPARLDELARKRSARRAAEEARRKATTPPPPGPQAC
ncbi:hypothetical protein [Conexibacter arvalis]|uniref:Septal ring factor EnvC (AmiA/AmiB activator) n=1 Tax=Conexibacter arvalis TaxID=912552 RepID=A0A840IJI9_9ACTN|nr:hypothetical protein [Conexibacter arvalis]MBB4664926.1 septal ring factor EnvC (AmiA/AmiB activator) [Conexibacter arvalis]